MTMAIRGRFGALARSWRSIRALSSIATLTPSSDLPRMVGEFDARAVRAENLLNAASVEASKFAEAYRLASEAASAGCPRGKTVKGTMLLHGYGEDSDIPSMRKLLEESAHAGDPLGMLMLAQMMLNDVESNEETTLDGEMVFNEEGAATFNAPNIEATTPAKMVREKRIARRRAGFSDMEAHEFEQYEHRKKEEQRQAVIDAAEQWILAAVDRGFDAAMVFYGNRLCEREQFAQGLQWYEKAIDATRNTDAYYNLGTLLATGAEGVPQDERRSYKCFSMAAQLGDAVAQAHMGAILREGTFERESDVAAARTYIELAAAQRNPDALYMLAIMHLEGEGGLEASAQTYLRYLTMAVDLDLPAAVAALADHHYKGEHGVETDYVKALALFKRAGKLGHADAMCSAAAMTYNGIGREADKHQAFLIYQEAVVLGSIAAMRNIGAMHFRGDGVPKNPKVAEQFFRMADEANDEEIKEAREFGKTPIRTMEAPAHPVQVIPRKK